MTLVKSTGNKKVNLDFNKEFINTFSEKIEFKALEGGRTWNYPTLANGLLFIRNSHEMACFDLRINSN